MDDEEVEERWSGWVREWLEEWALFIIGWDRRFALAVPIGLDMKTDLLSVCEEGKVTAVELRLKRSWLRRWGLLSSTRDTEWGKCKYCEDGGKELCEWDKSWLGIRKWVKCGWDGRRRIEFRLGWSDTLLDSDLTKFWGWSWAVWLFIIGKEEMVTESWGALPREFPRPGEELWWAGGAEIKDCGWFSKTLKDSRWAGWVE